MGANKATATGSMDSHPVSVRRFIGLLPVSVRDAQPGIRPNPVTGSSPAATPTSSSPLCAQEGGGSRRSDPLLLCVGGRRTYLRVRIETERRSTPARPPESESGDVED